jgi:cobalt-zinc-cadmium efflux system membrane fusion protein
MSRPASTAIALFVTVLLAACGGSPAEHPSAEHAGEAAEPERGPHRGRLLRDGDLQLEVSIFEDGVPPEYRLYATVAGVPVPPAQMQATIELRRITGIAGGVVDRHVFAAREDYLVSASEVYEPHSFDVSVRLEYAGKTHAWQYASPEARVEMDPAVAAAAELVTARAGPGEIADQLLLYGHIVPDAERVRQVRARFPGPVRSVPARLGDTVRAGQVLATIESNESLQTYAVTAPISGLVTARNVNVGESAAGDALFEIADYSSVWAELAVFPRDRGKLAPGRPVEVKAAEGELRGAGSIRFLSPVGAASSAVTARVVLDNSGRQWTPGQFVEAEVSVARHSVPLVVPLTALQRVRNWDVVFVNEGSSYQALPVTLGRRDSTHVEVLAGLAPGALFVTGNSYLVKADIEKSGASHDH